METASSIINFFTPLLALVGAVTGVWSFCLVLKDRQPSLRVTQVSWFPPGHDNIRVEGLPFPTQGVGINVFNKGQNPVTIEYVGFIIRGHEKETWVFTPDLRQDQCPNTLPPGQEATFLVPIVGMGAIEEEARENIIRPVAVLAGGRRILGPRQRRKP